MANRIFVSAVVVLWLGSMTWLMVDKVLPSLHEGEAPVVSGYENGVPVAWRVLWGDRPVGYAASIRLPGVLGTTNIQNRVKLQDAPLLDLVPALMRSVVGDIGSMTLDAQTRLEFDSLENFSRFTSTVSINDVAPVLELNGRVNGAFLDLTVRFGEVQYEPKVPIANQNELNEALFPDAKLPYLYVGRRWSEEVYNPFRAPSVPVDVVDVEVTGIETIDFENENQRTMRVEYMAPPAPGVPDEARLQAVAWVRSDDGLVLRQDLIISGTKLRFERLSQPEATEIGKTLFKQTHYDRRGRRGGPGMSLPVEGNREEWRGHGDGRGPGGLPRPWRPELEFPAESGPEQSPATGAAT